ncbi:MAG: hypothetical protein P0116_11935 [Candidatus Nitrosocosmicus sp.]|nr:hypothetical protein [Candidatus Nitrosocosmicus sp.]
MIALVSGSWNLYERKASKNNQQKIREIKAKDDLSYAWFMYWTVPYFPIMLIQS